MNKTTTNDKVRIMPKMIESPSEFVVPTKDDKNPQSGHVHFRIHPGYVRTGAEMYKPGIERGAPWKTQDDCDRWIWKCGLEAAGEKLKTTASGSMTAFDLFEKQTQLETEASYAQDLIKRVRYIVEQRQRIGADREDIEQYIRSGWRAINAIGYPRWRRYLLREFEGAFGNMMSRKASFNTADMEEERPRYENDD